MFNNYPYTNFHELNLEYFINHFKEIFTEWETLYNQMLEWKDSTIDELEAWKTAVENDLTDRETALRAELEEWKSETNLDIEEWELSTIADLNEWKDAAEAVFEAIRVQAAASATAAQTAQTAAEAAQSAAETAQSAAETAADAAEDAADSISASVAQIAENTSNIADLNNALSDIDERVDALENSVDGIDTDIYTDVTSDFRPYYGESSYPYVRLRDNNLITGKRYAFSFTPPYSGVLEEGTGIYSRASSANKIEDFDLIGEFTANEERFLTRNFTPESDIVITSNGPCIRLLIQNHHTGDWTDLENTLKIYEVTVNHENGISENLTDLTNDFSELNNSTIKIKEIVITKNFLDNNPEFIDFNNFPTNSIIRINADARPITDPETGLPSNIYQALDNAPFCFNTLGHVSNADRLWTVVNRGYPAIAETFESNIGDTKYIVQRCSGRNASDTTPIEFIAERIKKGNIWSAWNRLSDNATIHGTNKVVDHYTYNTFTFSDFNDAPINTIYQVDKNVVLGDVANNPTPGKSGVLMTFAFSATSRHALVQIHFALTTESSESANCVFKMFFRYGFEQSISNYVWTPWNEVQTTQVN